LRLNVGGLANDQAKVLLWRHDRYTIPTAVLENPDLVQQIEFLLGEAEELGGMLWGATRRLCEHFLAPMAFDPQGKPYEGTMKADPDKVTALASCIDPRPSYWARLESFFQTLLLHLPTEQERTPEDWKDAIETTARQSFEEAVTQLGDSIQALKAMSLTRPNFQAASRRPRTENGSKQKRNKKEVAK
jgi:CRISPR system Cascade subunit CasA